jgi:hypothetical protein
MKKLAIVTALLLILVLAYLWVPPSVPAGQQPLTVLSRADLHEFATAFDGDASVPRLVLLLSPT